MTAKTKWPNALIGAVALLALMTDAVSAQGGQNTPDLKTALFNAADALGVLRGLQQEDSIVRLEYWATGTILVGGQPCTVKTLHGSINYSVAGMRIDVTCTSGQRYVQAVSDRFAWNETQPGMNATPAQATLNERLIQLWALPQGVVKAVRAAGANAKVTVEGGATTLMYPLPAPLATATARTRLGTQEITVATGQKRRIGNLIERVETRLGDIVFETTYAEYGDWNDKDYKADVMFPRRIVHKQGGTTIADLTVERTNTYNPYVVVPVPENVQKAVPQGAAASR
jgi:opacity protein-like surface antigen